MKQGIGSGEPGTLLTGATGFLGGEVLCRLLERGGPHVTPWFGPGARTRRGVDWRA